MDMDSSLENSVHSLHISTVKGLRVPFNKPNTDSSSHRNQRKDPKKAVVLLCGSALGGVAPYP